MIEGRAISSPEMMPKADFQPITPNYFQAMGIPLVKGRQFHDTEMRAAPEVVIINHSLARRFWHDQDPLGKHIQLQGDNAPHGSLAVVGVVSDVKQYGLQTNSRPEIYLPMYRPSMRLIIRTSTSPGTLFAALRETMQKLDHGRAAFDLKTLEQVVIDSIEKRRIFTLLLGVLALVALPMAAMGIYGVISHLAAHRMREIGIRIALGAQPADVLRLIVGQGVKLALVGATAGVLAALALTRIMAHLLFGVSAHDPATFAGVVILLTGVAVVACYLPARKAAKVDPMVALRSE